MSEILQEVFRTIQGLDVLMGVHGAALTYFVFMRPGTALIQVGTEGSRGRHNLRKRRFKYGLTKAGTPFLSDSHWRTFLGRSSLPIFLRAPALLSPRVFLLSSLLTAPSFSVLPLLFCAKARCRLPVTADKYSL